MKDDWLCEGLWVMRGHKGTVGKQESQIWPLKLGGTDTWLDSRKDDQGGSCPLCALLHNN